MKSHYFLGLVAALSLIGFETSAADETVNASASYSQEFIQKAAVSNQFEILSSQEALTRTRDEDVRDFARRMIEDHSKAGQEMKMALVEAQNEMTLAEPGKTLDEKHQKILNDLRTAPASSFDRQYISAQVNAHNEALALFRSYAEDGNNTALRDFAVRTIPVLEMHKRHVDTLATGRLSAAQ